MTNNQTHEKGNERSGSNKDHNESKRNESSTMKFQEGADELYRPAKVWQQVFDAIPHFVALITPDFKFIRLNRAAYESLGKKPEEIIGRKCYEIVHGKDAPIDGCPCMQTMTTMKPAMEELNLEGRDLLVTASPVVDEKGGLLAIAHTMRDITGRKRSEEELRKYREHLEELVKERTVELRTANERLQSGIVELMQAEEEIKRSYHLQFVLNKLLHISLENIPMEEMFERIIDHIVSVNWLALESQGGIFLVEDEPDVLIMKAQRRLGQPLQTACARVPFGRCLCGRAAKSGEIEFADCVDERHENRYEGMPDHGHYCVPIISSDKKTLGVITLYLKKEHPREEREEEFLRAVANVLAGIIQRKQAEERIIQASEQLEIERESLERKNIALHEILNQIDSEKNTFKQHLVTNVEQTILPTVTRLKKSSRPSQNRIFEMLEKDLQEIVSPFLDTLKSNYTKLSPRELEVCRLIKNGMTSKEIAEMLNLSLLTVYKYRELIRKKLSLVKDGTNLRTYLKSL